MTNTIIHLTDNSLDPPIAELCRRAAVIRWVIASALNRHLLALEQTIARPVGAMRRKVCDAVVNEMDPFHQS